MERRHTFQVDVMIVEDLLAEPPRIRHRSHRPTPGEHGLAGGRHEPQPISVIAQGMEKYLTLSLGKILKFKDRLQLLGGSLEQIGKFVRPSGMDKCSLLRGEFPHAATEQFDLLLGKQDYPYE